METPDNKDEIIELFKLGPAILESALNGIDDLELDYLPAKGGWTIREIVHHLADGDDIWKYGIKMALGKDASEFSLQWYAAYPQMEWGNNWGYNKRPIDISLNLLKAGRLHVAQLIESVDNAWSKELQFRKPDGEIEILPVGFIVQMQTNHITHHVQRISEIRQEYLNR